MPTNLYQRPGSPYWWARIQINGRDQRRSLRTADRAEARKRLKALTEAAEAERAGIAVAERRDWKDAVERWLSMQAADLRPSTLTRYKTSLKQLDPHFRGKDVATLTGADFHAYAAARMRQGITAATVRRDLTVASRVMRVAKRAQWIKDNPVPEEASELKERREPIQPVRLRALARIVRAAPQGFRDLIRFAFRAGCRQKEATMLKKEWVDLRAGTATFPLTKSRVPRVINLSEQAVRDLSRAMGQSTGDYVFVSRDGEPYASPASQWRVLVRRVIKKGPWPRFHDLRHTHAIRALQGGQDIYSLAGHLGHSSVKTTERYLAWVRQGPAQKPAQSPKAVKMKAA